MSTPCAHPVATYSPRTGEPVGRRLRYDGPMVRSLAARVCLGLVACAVTGCHLLSGVGDLEFVDQGPGGSASSSSGGHAGSGAAGGSGGGGSGGGTIASTGTERCRTAMPRDDFGSGAVDPSVWALAADAQTGVENGRWYVAPDPGAAAGQSGILYSKLSYDHRECSAWIEVPTVFDAAVAGDARFYFWGAMGYEAKIWVAAGTISFDVTENWVETSLNALPYEPVAHRWWRLRETGGTLYFETSPDGHDWTVRHSADDPSYIASSTVEFGGATTALMAAAGRLEFDNVDMLP